MHIPPRYGLPECVCCAVRGQEMPRLVDGGEDVAPEAPVEEEFDLSDILAEEVSAAPGSKEDLLRRADQELLVSKGHCQDQAHVTVIVIASGDQ